MLKTFNSLDYEVTVVMGDRNHRKILYQKLAKKIKDGAKFDYVYVESLSRPTNSRITKNLPFKLLVRENIDFNFLELCQSEGLKVGFYLRDLHWDFKEHMVEEGLIKRSYLKTVLRHFGKSELKFLSSSKIEVFTPSTAFSDYIYKHWNLTSTQLPPGAKIKNANLKSLSGDCLNMFYVGGLKGVYRPEVFLKGVVKSKKCSLTICARAAEHYLIDKFINKNSIKVVVGEGDELNMYFNKSDLGVYLLPPHGYAKLAHSVKLSEYIAHGLPIIAFNGTHASEFIKEHRIGWTMPYNSDEVSKLIDHINRNPKEYAEYQQNVIHIQQEFTWEKVIEKLENKLLKK